MFAALSISSFLSFLKSAIFLVGYISNNNLFPEPLNAEDEKIYLERFKNGDEEVRNILLQKLSRMILYL